MYVLSKTGYPVAFVQFEADVVYFPQVFHDEVIDFTEFFETRLTHNQLCFTSAPDKPGTITRHAG